MLVGLGYFLRELFADFANWNEVNRGSKPLFQCTFSSSAVIFKQLIRQVENG